MITEITIVLKQKIKYKDEYQLLDYLDKIYKFDDLDLPKSIVQVVTSSDRLQHFTITVFPPELIDLRSNFTND